ncbi:MAG: RhuM family protein [Desulfuromonadaceae bacterium]|nr:RhuM family protein [Desulfuromonadaceae bacterium]
MRRNRNVPVPNNSFTDFLLYISSNGKIKVEVFLHDENIWLSQEKIAALFGVQRPAITKHLKNIFDSGELAEYSVSSILEHTAADGKNYKTKFYNLDAIISVGYRVNSTQATHFRIWATERLREYIIKGFTMDDERLKNPNTIFGKDYFEEQLARIRDIRSSERRFYQKITDIYSQCSADYDANSEITKLFFATVQNKLHWAIKRWVNSKEELRRLFQFSDQFHADELPTKAGIDKLDKLRFRDFLRDVCKQDYPDSSSELLRLLQNMNLATEDGVLNLAGVLMFAERPEWIKPQFVVKARQGSIMTH